MTEELISRLLRIDELRVIARTSVLKYKGTDKDIAEIGRALQAGTILEGSVRTAANQVRFTAQLIDASSQEHLWAEDYDRALKGIFAIQSGIETLPVRMNRHEENASAVANFLVGTPQ